MSINHYIKSMLADELRWQTRLTDETITRIIEAFSKRMELRRHTIVPTYLTDDMYEAAKIALPGVNFQVANDMYRSAVSDYNKRRNLIEPDDQEDTGSFW